MYASFTEGRIRLSFRKHWSIHNNNNNIHNNNITYSLDNSHEARQLTKQPYQSQMHKSATINITVTQIVAHKHRNIYVSLETFSCQKPLFLVFIYIAVIKLLVLYIIIYNDTRSWLMRSQQQFLQSSIQTSASLTEFFLTTFSPSFHLYGLLFLQRTQRNANRQ